ncbi:MAG: hypothetical protein FD146_1536 [Anaerolineaceae bacterium]|nr:MAG: hypothetical protein FD146_1536 [Anaerolineaceae bacterium]
MKILRPILAMLTFLALGFLADYVLDRVVPGDPLPYYWSALLCQVIFGALFLLLVYFTLHKGWLTHGTAIAYVVVGGVILLWTPGLVSLMQKYPDLRVPGFTPRSFFIMAGVIVAVTGVLALLPKKKKRK